MPSLRFSCVVLLTVLVGSSHAASIRDLAMDAYTAGRFEEARRLWTPRAEAGDARAQFGLGLLHDIGQGVRQDPAAAYRWYLRAADAGATVFVAGSSVYGAEDAAAAIASLRAAAGSRAADGGHSGT